MCFRINVFLACPKQSQNPWTSVIYEDKKENGYFKNLNLGLFSVSRNKMIIVLIVLFAQECNQMLSLSELRKRKRRYILNRGEGEANNV